MSTAFLAPYALLSGDEGMGLPDHSEEATALRFSKTYADDLRYVAAWGKWLTWHHHRWQVDNTLSVFDRARGICREAAVAHSVQGEQGKAPKLAAASTVAAIERLARADRRHAATVDQWDADDWLLNTPGGAVDLRTGRIRPAERKDYCTKITTAAPGGDCELWRHFLHRVTGGNGELQAFMQRMCGYCLTGSTRDHALFFGYGTGGNGKGVFVNTFSGALGDYSRVAPIETFVQSKTEQHPTDLAGLQGARLVTAAETEDGRRWAESKIKALTGGDRIAARFMRQDFFEFTPRFKLLITGNHKPGIRTVDEAIRRRFHLLPFTVTIPEAERDSELTGRLKSEYGGILQWAIDGCLEWQRVGLDPPEAVRTATDSYLDSEDALGRWIDEACVRVSAWTSSTTLFESWAKWSGQPGSQRRFSQNLEARGFVRTHEKEGNGFNGIGLRDDR